MRKMLLILGALLLFGLIYAYGASHWGWHLVCIFNQITGFQCPGCGVSRMCLALLRLDFEGAFYWNPALLICLPFLAYLLGYLCWRYVRWGDLNLKGWREALCWMLLVFLLLFGILRNL